MGELSRQSDLKKVPSAHARLRQAVQLCDKKGIVFQRSQEQERWIAGVTGIPDFGKANCKELARRARQNRFRDAMVKPSWPSWPWKKPRTLEEAKQSQTRSSTT